MPRKPTAAIRPSESALTVDATDGVNALSALVGLWSGGDQGVLLNTKRLSKSAAASRRCTVLIRYEPEGSADTGAANRRRTVQPLGGLALKRNESR